MAVVLIGWFVVSLLTMTWFSWEIEHAPTAPEWMQ